MTKKPARDPVRHKLAGEWLLLAPSPSTPARAPQGGPFTLDLRLCLTNPSNSPMANQNARAAERKAQRETVQWAWLAAGYPQATYKPARVKPGQVKPTRDVEVALVPERVVITRIGPRELDGDNVQAAAKSVRDAIAEILGFNDRLKVWEYRQEKAQTWGCRIEVWFPTQEASDGR